MKETTLKDIHMVVEPLHLIDDVQAAVHNERIHLPCLHAEPSNAVTSLFRSAEFELKQRIVTCADDAEVVGHDDDPDSMYQ